MKQNTGHRDADPAPGHPGADAMTPGERRATLALAGIFTLRMLGLFMILPVFSLYAPDYPDYSPLLAGFGLGVYGLTQAMFQIPFGLLSDRIGRKRVITVGLLLFAIGSVLAASADTLAGIVAGRALQGLGAIAAAVLALTADLTRAEQRTKAMAVIGVSIGIAFALAMVIGPWVSARAGLPGLFWLTGGLAIGAVAVLHRVVPDPVVSRFHRDAQTEPRELLGILADGQLLRIDAGILLLHAIMTASFVVLPLVLRDRAGVPGAEQWKVYAVVLAVSVTIMALVVVRADRRGQLKSVFIASVVVLALSQAGLAVYGGGLVSIALLMVAYFTAFNLLEASAPSLVSRLAPPHLKGTALGAYATAQYAGAFFGGVLGGWIHGSYGEDAVFGLGAALAGAWLVIAVSMRNPPPLASELLRVGPLSAGAAREVTARLLAVRGVVEAVVVVEDGTAYLKVDPRVLDRPALRAISPTSA